MTYNNKIEQIICDLEKDDVKILDYIDWSAVSSIKDLSVAFITYYRKYINFNVYKTKNTKTINPLFNTDIKCYVKKDKQDFNLKCYTDITDKIEYAIEQSQNINEFDWNALSAYRYWSDNFIYKFKNYLVWNIATTIQIFCERNIRQNYISNINYNALGLRCNNLCLSLDFIFENLDIKSKTVVNKKYIDNEKLICSWTYVLFQEKILKKYNKTKICDDMLTLVCHDKIDPFTCKEVF